MNKLLFTILAVCIGLLASCNFAYGQEVTPNPPVKVCISQEAANIAASNAVELQKLRAENSELKAGRAEDAKLIKDLEIKLAVEIQRSTDAENQIRTMNETIRVLLENTKRRNKFGLIVF